VILQAQAVAAAGQAHTALSRIFYPNGGFYGSVRQISFES